MTEEDGTLIGRSQDGTQWKKKLKKKPQKVPKIVVVKMTSMRKCLINIDQNRKGKRKRRRRGNVLLPQAAAVTAIALPRVNFLATAQLRVITVQSIRYLFMD